MFSNFSYYTNLYFMLTIYIKFRNYLFLFLSCIHIFSFQLSLNNFINETQCIQCILFQNEIYQITSSFIIDKNISILGFQTKITFNFSNFKQIKDIFLINNGSKFIFDGIVFRGEHFDSTNLINLITINNLDSELIIKVNLTIENNNFFRIANLKNFKF